MFDKLVESTNQKRSGRTGRYFLTTTLAYAGALTLLAVATVFWFNPALAETLEATAMLAPPPPPAGPPPQSKPVQIKESPREIFAAPTKPPVNIADPTKVPPRNRQGYDQPHTFIAGAPVGIGNAPTNFTGNGDGEAAPPPPPPQPIVTPTPAPTPTPQQTVRMTSQMTQSKAIRRVQPPYPAIARQARISGPVQVQVTISEDGTVSEATPLSGHPLLREASLQAARQWAFSPTLLNNKPVRVVGVLTFNFTLN